MDASTAMDSAAPPIQKSQVSIKTTLWVCLTVLGVALAVGVVFLARYALSIIAVSLLVALAMERPVQFLEKRGWRRGLAIACVTLAGLLALTGIGVLLVPPTVKQGKELVEQGPALVQKARTTPLYQKLNPRLQLDQRLASLEQTGPGLLKEYTGPVMKLAGSLLLGLGGALTVFFLTLFMLLSGGSLVRALVNEALPQRRLRYQQVLSRMYQAVGGYVSGLGILCLINAVLTTLFLWVLKVPGPIALGVFSGLFSLLPLVGSVASGLVITAVAFTVSAPVGIAVGIFNLAYQELESRIFAPIVYRRSLRLNSLVVMMAFLVFAELGGVLGAVIAIPVVATLQVLVQELFALRRERLDLPLYGPAGRIGQSAPASGPTLEGPFHPVQ